MNDTNKKVTLLIYRGDQNGALEKFETEVSEGMVVLDALLQIQMKDAPDLAFRYNCHGGRCTSCIAEINGKTALMCKTRLKNLPLDEPVVVKPVGHFPVIKDLVPDITRILKIKKPEPEQF
ncbi:2Fe-2S iron-sulfur cluster binding domain-containing protein [candidate division KSB1 bacterium]|nr:2Fe-2S iron-sulfur cluster binding domain-containing protein [candidate division KSB1 bacterium]